VSCKRSVEENLAALSVRNPVTGCLEWQGSRRSGGYGQYGKGSIPAHRVAFEMVNGPIPDGMIVCHRCDNPPCIEPSHLFLGTHALNAADKVAKGRHPRGEAAAPAKLTETQVLAVLADKATSNGDLARSLGVHPATIRDIRSGRNWRHLQLKAI
jgi:hypothetical protein